jgi:hypothetical protein
MVPLDDDAFFCLQDGAGLTLQGSEDSEALILMTEQGGSNAQNQFLRNITIRGLTSGNGIIEARQGNLIHARLQYTVFKRLEFEVRFFTVRDKGQRNWSKRPMSDPRGMIRSANAILLPQANISFTYDGFFFDNVDIELPAKLPDIGGMFPPGPSRYQNFGGPIRSYPVGPSYDWIVWAAIFKPAVQDKRVFNVFFVWRTVDWNTPAQTLGNCCYIQDGVARPTVVFAHEGGHFLLGPDFKLETGGHTSGKLDLMQMAGGELDIRVPMDQAFRMQIRWG